MRLPPAALSLDKVTPPVVLLPRVMESSPIGHAGGAASPRAFLEGVRAKVDARLRDTLDAARAFTEAAAPATLPMLDAARDLTLRGGKRLRPAMLFAAVECVEPAAHPEAATDLGVALELLQTYLLVHDDWMDDDPVRRGAPSVHVALARVYGEPHLGACTAILAGDLMGALVHRIVADLDLPTARRRAVNAVFAEMEHEVILGQCLDVTRSPDVARIHTLKTGSYTVRGPLLLGASVAGASEAQRRALAAYAEPLGLAFQLRDDVLGVFGSAAETGKPVGNDLREGKQTALVQHALGNLDDAGRDALRAVLGRRDASEDEVLHAREIIARSGAREAVEREIASLRAACLDALRGASLLPRGVELLTALASMLTERSR